MQERTIYTLTPYPRRRLTPVKLLEKPKRKTIHITAESLKNKLLGASLIVVGILSAKLTGDGTAMVMIFFIGLTSIFSK